jgi:hypothetical protein
MCGGWADLTKAVPHVSHSIKSVPLWHFLPPDTTLSKYEDIPEPDFDCNSRNLDDILTGDDQIDISHAGGEWYNMEQETLTDLGGVPW